MPSRTRRARRDDQPVSIDLLEPRRLLAGVTIITHGQQDSSVMPGWVTEMADAIDERLGSPATRITITVRPESDVGTPLVAAVTVPVDASLQSPHGEIVVLLNWAAAAQGGVPVGWAQYSTVDVAAAVLPELLGISLPGMSSGIAEVPIHLIGHSRGGSLVAQLARGLAQRGLWVDQLTTLDPHPRDLPFGSGDAAMGVAWAVGFADNYYQSSESAFVDGEPVVGATDRYLRRLYGGYEGQDYSNHSNVHLWYHGTIDIAGGASDGAAILFDSDRDTWYAPNELRGSGTGFGYSRIGTLSRSSDIDPAGLGQPPRLGLHSVLGGAASREETDVPLAVWPNIVGAGLTGSDDGLVTAADASEFVVRYWDADSAVTIEAYLDDDNNPYNGYGALLGSATGESTPGRTVGEVRFALNSAALQSGRFSLQMFIRDSAGRVRILPSRTSLEFQGAGVPPVPPDPIPLPIDPLPIDPQRLGVALDPADPSRIGVRSRMSDGTLRFHELDARGTWSSGSVSPGDTPPLAISDPLHWRGPSGAPFTAYIAGTDLIVLDETAASPSIRDISTLLGLTAPLYGEIDFLDSPSSSQVRIVGRLMDGDVVLFTSPDGVQWSMVNIFADHLRANGRAAPAFEGPIVTYTTSWGGLNIAGLTADGTLWSVWTSPEAGGWYSSDLTAVTGAPRIVGGLAPYVTPWGGINLAGREPDGTLSVTWWVPGFGGEWRRADFSAEFGRVDFVTSTIVSFVTPWNALNIAGADADGNLWMYWWEPSRAGDPERDRWTLSRIEPSDRATGALSDVHAAGPITPLSTPSGRIDLFSTDLTGTPVRLWWDSAAADRWSAEVIGA